MKKLLPLLLVGGLLLFTGCGDSKEEIQAQKQAEILKQKHALLEAQHKLDIAQQGVDKAVSQPLPPVTRDQLVYPEPYATEEPQYAYETGYDAQGYPPSSPSYTPATADTGYSTGALIAAGLGGAIVGNMMSGSGSDGRSDSIRRTTINKTTIINKTTTPPVSAVDKQKKAAAHQALMKKQQLDKQNKLRQQKIQRDKARLAAKRKAVSKSRYKRPPHRKSYSSKKRR